MDQGSGGVRGGGVGRGRSGGSYLSLRTGRETEDVETEMGDDGRLTVSSSYDPPTYRRSDGGDTPSATSSKNDGNQRRCRSSPLLFRVARGGGKEGLGSSISDSFPPSTLSSFCPEGMSVIEKGTPPCLLCMESQSHWLSRANRTLKGPK